MSVRAFFPGKTYSFCVGAGLCLTIFFGCMGCLSMQQDTFSQRAEVHAEIALNHFADQLRVYPLPPDSITSLLEQFLRDNDFISSVTFAYAPVRENGQILHHAPKVLRQKGRFIQSDASENGFDYTAAKWYSIPAKTGKSFWTDWHSEKKGSRLYFKTYAVPVYAQNDPEKLIGVVTCDISSE